MIIALGTAYYSYVTPFEESKTWVTLGVGAYVTSLLRQQRLFGTADPPLPAFAHGKQQVRGVEHAAGTICDILRAEYHLLGQATDICIKGERSSPFHATRPRDLPLTSRCYAHRFRPKSSPSLLPLNLLLLYLLHPPSSPHFLSSPLLPAQQPLPLAPPTPSTPSTSPTRTLPTTESRSFISHRSRLKSASESSSTPTEGSQSPSLSKCWRRPWSTSWESSGVDGRRGRLPVAV